MHRGFEPSDLRGTAIKFTGQRQVVGVTAIDSLSQLRLLRVAELTALLLWIGGFFSQIAASIGCLLAHRTLVHREQFVMTDASSGSARANHTVL